MANLPRPRRAAPARLPPRQAPQRTQTPAAVAAILLSGLLAYSNSFAGVLVFDDEPAIVENPYIRQLWPLTDAMAAPEGTTVSGRPVVSLTLALNHALAPAGVRDVLSLPPRDASALDRERLRRNLRGYHALNLAVHLATALALFGIVRRTLWSEPLRQRFGAPATALALATALLWTVHPLQTAAVTYVIQRAESLMAMFLALTLYCAIRAFQGSRLRALGSRTARGSRLTAHGSRLKAHGTRRSALGARMKLEEGRGPDPESTSGKREAGSGKLTVGDFFTRSQGSRTTPEIRSRLSARVSHPAARDQRSDESGLASGFTPRASGLSDPGSGSRIPDPGLGFSSGFSAKATAGRPSLGERNPGDGGGARWWTAGAVVACALGMGSKETMIVAPFVVALWDWTFAPRQGARRARLALYAALAGTWVILALLVSGHHRPDAAGFGFAGWPWWRYLITQAGVIAHYLRLAVFPFPLVLDYRWPAARVADVLPQLVVLIGLVAVSARGAIARRPWGFAGGAFFIVLAPTSSILPIVTEVAAEHRMYLPLAPLLALIVVGGYYLLGRWTPAAAGRLGALAVAVLAVAGVGATYARNTDYQDIDRIWLDTILRRPLNARARNNYATALLAQGRFSEAEAHVRVAVQVEPSAVEAQQTLGVALRAQSRCAEGMAHLQIASRLAPSSPDVQRNLAEAYASMGRMSDAVVHYQRALDLRPDDLHLLNRAGWILATDEGAARDGARALRLAEHAVRLSARGDVESLDTLAAAYAEVGRFEDAIATAAEALRLAPSQSPEMLPELEHRLALYRMRRVFRQE